MNIIQAMESKLVFRSLFKDLKTWHAWEVFLKGTFNIRMQRSERRLFCACTGLRSPYKGKIKEAWVLVSRRGGKSFISSLLAVYLACFKDWNEYLSPGERPYVFVISVTKFQARTIKDYIVGILRSNGTLANLIESDKTWEIELKNGVIISCQACSYRGVRGKTVVCAILEEVCFWRWQAESAIQDIEVIRGLTPSMGTIPESILISISSPYITQGVMAEKFKKYYGTKGPILCWKADTLTMNPTFSKKAIKQAYKDDPEGALAEYGGEWRRDVSPYIPPEVIEEAIIQKRFELRPVKEFEYLGSIDPSGGRSDSFTMSIVHKDDKKIVVDALREARPPFKPENVVEEYCKLFKKYGIYEVGSDRYAGEWVTSAFREFGVYVALAKKTKSEFYLNFLPLLNNDRIELLDNARLGSQLGSLQRKTRSQGKDVIDNFLPGGHDDCANVVAMGCVGIAEREDEGPGWVYHLGMKEEEAKEDGREKKPAEEKRKPAPEPFGKLSERGKKKEKKPEEEEQRYDESWVL